MKVALTWSGTFLKIFLPPTESQEEDGDIEVEEAEGEENDRPYNLRQRKTVERYQAPPIGEEPDNAHAVLLFWPAGIQWMWGGNSWMATPHPWLSNRDAALCDFHPDLLWLTTWMGLLRHSLSVCQWWWHCCLIELCRYCPVLGSGLEVNGV